NKSDPPSDFLIFVAGSLWNAAVGCVQLNGRKGFTRSPRPKSFSGAFRVPKRRSPPAAGAQRAPDRPPCEAFPYTRRGEGTSNLRRKCAAIGGQARSEGDRPGGRAGSRRPAGGSSWNARTAGSTSSRWTASAFAGAVRSGGCQSDASDDVV